MTGINRPLTDRDKQYIDVDLNRSKHRLTSRERFQIEMNKYEKDAAVKGVPFARHAARDDFEDDLQLQMAKLKRQDQFVDIQKLVLPDTDWTTYSDLKNFEVVEGGEVPDTNLSNKNPGLNVTIKKVVYKFKDYGNKYTIMESGADAINRAQERTWDMKSKATNQPEAK